MRLLFINLAQLAVALLFGLFTSFNLVRELANRRDFIYVAMFSAMTYAAYRFIRISTKEFKYSLKKGVQK